jgi:glycosyltransferase involved in cell wall biosynthesis
MNNLEIIHRELKDLHKDGEYLTRLSTEIRDLKISEATVVLDMPKEGLRNSVDQFYLWLRQQRRFFDNLRLCGPGNLPPTFDVSQVFSTARLVHERTLKNSGPLKISIISPVKRGREKELKKFLESLGAQSLAKEQWELVLIADGDFPISMDMESALSRVPQLRFYICPFPEVRKKFRVGELRNLGAALARGELLLFADSDLWLGPLLLQVTERTLIEDNVWIQVLRQQSSKLMALLDGRHWARFAEDRFRWNDTEDPWQWASSYCFGVKKARFFEVGGFSSSFSHYGFEDCELGYRWQREGGRFQLLRLPVLHLEKGTWRFLGKAFLKYWGTRRSAQNFYLQHLDPAIYRRLFTLMGPHRLIRVVFDRWSRLPSAMVRPVFKLLTLSPKSLVSRISFGAVRSVYNRARATLQSGYRNYVPSFLQKIRWGFLRQWGSFRSRWAQSPLLRPWYFYSYHYKRNYRRLWAKNEI